jgi:hypothetical protein
MALNEKLPSPDIRKRRENANHLLTSTLFYARQYMVSIRQKLREMQIKTGSERNNLRKFDVHVSVHHRHSEGKEPTRCDKVCSFCSFYCLNMFRAPICPSSGVQLVNIFCF